MNYAAQAGILSQPHRVMWAGWESSTTRLQQCGWQLSAEQDLYSDSIRIAFRHPQTKLYGISDRLGVHYFQLDNRPLVFNIVHVASDFVIQMVDNLSAFAPIDAMPQFIENRKSIEDFKIFAPSLVRTQEIIVEPSSVNECLELIKKLQAPELDAIRERNKSRDRRMESGTIQRQVFHAQILSLAA